MSSGKSRPFCLGLNLLSCMEPSMALVRTADRCLWVWGNNKGFIGGFCGEVGAPGEEKPLCAVQWDRERVYQEWSSSWWQNRIHFCEASN